MSPSERKYVQGYRTQREIGDLLPNNQRQRRTCYALCHMLYPVSAAHTSIFRMDSNSTSYLTECKYMRGAVHNTDSLATCRATNPHD